MSDDDSARSEKKRERYRNRRGDAAHHLPKTSKRFNGVINRNHRGISRLPTIENEKKLEASEKSPASQWMHFAQDKT